MKSSKTSRSNSMLTLVSVAVIVIFTVICAFAAVPKIQEHFNNIKVQEEDAAVASGEKEPNVAYAARQTGVSVEDYLTKYGLTLGGDITEQTTLNDLTNSMTISNYVNFVNDENGSADESSKLDVDSYLSQYSDAVTADTTIKDLYSMSAETALGSDTFNATKEQFSLGDEVTSETTLEEFYDAINQAMQAAAAASTPAPDAAAAEGETQTAEAPAETPAE